MSSFSYGDVLEESLEDDDDFAYDEVDVDAFLNVGGTTMDHESAAATSDTIAGDWVPRRPPIARRVSAVETTTGIGRLPLPSPRVQQQQAQWVVPSDALDDLLRTSKEGVLFIALQSSDTDGSPAKCKGKNHSDNR